VASGSSVSVFGWTCRRVNYNRASAIADAEAVKEEDMMRNALRTLFGVVVLGVVVAPAIQAVNMNNTTSLTFSAPVELAGVMLPAGRYIFEVANPDSGANVVRVLSRNRSRVQVRKITTPTYRESTSDMRTLIKLGEAPAGKPPAILAWFPANETRGHQFAR
jgi:hypothetical protein